MCECHLLSPFNWCYVGGEVEGCWWAELLTVLNQYPGERAAGQTHRGVPHSPHPGSGSDDNDHQQLSAFYRHIQDFFHIIDAVLPLRWSSNNSFECFLWGKIALRVHSPHFRQGSSSSGLFHFCDYFCSIFATTINSFLFANCNRKRPEQRMGSEPQALQLQFYRIYSYKLPSRFFCPLYLVGGLVPAQAVPQFTMWACSMLPFSSHSGPICWRGALFHCRLNTRFADVTLACTLSVSIQVFCSFKILHCCGQLKFFQDSGKRWKQLQPSPCFCTMHKYFCFA